MAHTIGFLQFDVRCHGVPVRAAGHLLLDFAATLLGTVPEPAASFLRDADPVDGPPVAPGGRGGRCEPLREQRRGDR